MELVEASQPFMARHPCAGAKCHLHSAQTRHCPASRPVEGAAGLVGRLTGAWNCTAGCMEGKFLDDAMVRRLEKLPSKKELIATIARLIKQARQPAHRP